MDYQKLAKIIFKKMKPKLESNNGLSIFASERAKFEGWFKVELCESLSKYFNRLTPEKNRIDVTFYSWAIELKMLSVLPRIPSFIISAFPRLVSKRLYSN